MNIIGYIEINQVNQEYFRNEIDVIQRACLWRSFNMAFFAGSSRLVMLVIFVSYVYLSEKGAGLSPESVFSSLALLNVVKITFALFFPSGVSQLGEAKASVQRIQSFLLSDEKLDSSKSGFYVHEEAKSSKGMS